MDCHMLFNLLVKNRRSNRRNKNERDNVGLAELGLTYTDI